MKISALNETYKPAARKANVAFGGTATAVLKDIPEATKKAINEVIETGKEAKFNKLINFLEGLKNNSERVNTLATAFGTALVAPIFIAFNPFSKEDKDTKTYSAMRQPISAVITVIFQILVNNKFNHWLERTASTASESPNKFFEKIDLSRKQNDQHLKRIIKEDHPYYSAQQVRDEIKKRQNEKTYAAINGERKRLVDDKPNLEKLTPKDLEYFDYEKMAGLDEYKAAHDEIALELKQEFKNKGIELSPKQLEKEVKAKLKKEPEKLKNRAIEIVERRVIAETENKVDLAAKVKAAVKDGKTEAEIKEKFKEAAEKRQAELKKLVEAAKNEGKPAAIELQEKLDIVEKQIDKIENFGMKTSEKYFDKTFEEALKMVKIKKSINTSIKFAEGRFGSIKTWGGMAIALVTLPFSCGLLNWAYPRIMEKFMPEVSNAKKTKEAK